MLTPQTLRSSAPLAAKDLAPVPEAVLRFAGRKQVHIAVWSAPVILPTFVLALVVVEEFRGARRKQDRMAFHHALVLMRSALVEAI